MNPNHAEIKWRFVASSLHSTACFSTIAFAFPQIFAFYLPRLPTTPGSSERVKSCLLATEDGTIVSSITSLLQMPFQPP